MTPWIPLLEGTNERFLTCVRMLSSASGCLFAQTLVRFAELFDPKSCRAVWYSLDSKGASSRNVDLCAGSLVLGLLERGSVFLPIYYDAPAGSMAIRNVVPQKIHVSPTWMAQGLNCSVFVHCLDTRILMRSHHGVNRRCVLGGASRSRSRERETIPVRKVGTSRHEQQRWSLEQKPDNLQKSALIRVGKVPTRKRASAQPAELCPPPWRKAHAHDSPQPAPSPNIVLRLFKS